jgi:hypothetical protein
LEEKFVVKELVMMEFEYGGRIVKSKFYILPKVRQFKILIGKAKIKNILVLLSKSKK